MALGLVGVHDYPVTVHAATQRIGAGFVVDTGLMLANMPADVEFQEIENPALGARTSSLIRWIPFGLAPGRRVHLPAPYREPIEALYDEACLSRTVLQSDNRIGGGESELDCAYDGRRQTLRIGVARAGRDLGAKVDAEIRGSTNRGCLIAHVDLRLGDAATLTAVEILRARGFSFAGLLPELRDGDALRMQWLSDSVDDGVSTILSTDATRAIEAFVFEDRSTVVG
jgi:serine/threonine-protein kinase RsbW